MKDILGQTAEQPVKGSLLHGTEYNPHRTKVKGYLADNYHGEMQKLITANMQKAGYEGILYSPHRYGEFELKVFDPKQVLTKDFWSPEALSRKFGPESKRFSADRKWLLNLPMTSEEGISAGQRMPWQRKEIPPRVYDWMAEGSKASESSLGHLYKDIPLEEMVKKGGSAGKLGTPKAQATGWYKDRW